jgi:hypothetical protein
MIPIPAATIRALLAPKRESAVRDRALRHDYGGHEVLASAFVVADVLLFQGEDAPAVVFPNLGNTAFERWVEETTAVDPYRGHILAGWATVSRNDAGLYPVFLYNHDFEETRRVLSLLLGAEPAPPPYLDLVLRNALRQATGVSHDGLAALAGRPFEDTARCLRELFSDDRVGAWLLQKRQPLRFYGGATNTVLGLYDSIFETSETGLEHFNRSAEARYDLGGGYCTSEIERLMDRSFLSADVVTPRFGDLDPELLLHVAGKKGVHRVATRAEREAHAIRQDRVVHLPLDVLENGFPRDADSYAIVSAGFMTSTVRPHTRPIEWQGEGNLGIGHVGLSLHAIMRVLELVQLGKSVDLFTLQRASSRVYRYKTALLQWRDCRLVRLVTTNDLASARRWAPEAMTELRRRVGPGAGYFARPATE